MSFLVDGISSSARVLPLLDGEMLSIAGSSGPYLHGADGRRYVDTAMSFGATMLGHAHPDVIEAAIAAMRNGPMPAFSHAGEDRAAGALAAACAPLDKVVFHSSGSEAVHMACRIARTVTCRARVAKLTAGFDGWLDEIAFGNVASPEAGFADGCRPANDKIVLLRFNDFDDVERLFAEQDDIAAIVYEPMLANAACLEPSPGYLEHLQRVARAHGALLIADEVLMGFRLRAGLASHHLGLDPDLAALGKAIGSGVPVAAVIGRAGIMEAFHAAKGLRGGTYSGNPVACAAVETTMRLLAGQDYPSLQARGNALRQEIVDIFAAEGLAISTTGYGDVFSIWFGSRPPADYAEALAMANPARSLALHLALRRNGVIIMPSAYGRLYTTFAHDEEAMGLTRAAFAAAARSLATAALREAQPVGI
jgi:glutamate-1-semialdehyde 2,1-aminomutase